MGKMQVFDNRGKIKYTIDSTTGFMKVKASLCRDGIQQYLGVEMGLNDRAKDIINVYRDWGEVWNDNNRDSYKGAIVTDDHPITMVTIDNSKDLTKGYSTDVKTIAKNNTSYVKGDLVITDKAMIEKIKSGKKEISLGYTTNTVKQDGVHNGQKYEYVQKDIMINHIAIVDAGRCGGSCKITNDSKKDTNLQDDKKDDIIQDDDKNLSIGDKMIEIEIDGKKVQVCDTTNKYIEALKAQVKASKTKANDSAIKQLGVVHDRHIDLQSAQGTLTFDKAVEDKAKEMVLAKEIITKHNLTIDSGAKLEEIQKLALVKDGGFAIEALNDYNKDTINGLYLGMQAKAPVIQQAVINVQDSNKDDANKSYTADDIVRMQRELKGGY